MTDAQTPGRTGGGAAESRRAYDSSRRRAQVAETRERILDAAAEMAHALPTWDWSGLTFKTVAQRASVGERSMYRYFGTEQELHEALVLRLKREAGVEYDDLQLDEMAETSARTFAALGTFAGAVQPTPEPAEPALEAEYQLRRRALLHAVTPHAEDWNDEQRLLVVAVLDLLWDIPAYEHLIRRWGLSGDQATEAVKWGLDALVDAIHHKGPPAP